ncbi:hypothetical protein H6789_01020 [Candidatus Nomurabacteria bacterium]|nr:hypothetical protein [Candidatus Nomurabacteria bacterium]
MVKLKTLILVAVAMVVPVIANAQIVSGNLEVTFQNTPLFSESSVTPGTVVARTVTVRNLGSDTESVYTSLQNATSTGLSDFMELSINDGGGTVHLATTTFSTLFTATPIALGTISGGDTIIYTYVASLPSGVSGAYAGTSMSFDLVVGFEGGSSVSDGGSGGGGGGGGGGNDDDTPTPLIAGASTSTQPFWDGIVSRLNDLAQRSLGAVLGTSDSVATTTGEEIIDENQIEGDENVFDNGSEDSWTDFLCKYLWILVIIWLLVSAVAYYFRNSFNEINILFISQVFFATVAIFFLLSTLFFGTPCSLWPSLIVAVGSIVGSFISNDEG